MFAQSAISDTALGLFVSFVPLFCQFSLLIFGRNVEQRLGTRTEKKSRLGGWENEKFDHADDTAYCGIFYCKSLIVCPVRVG
jgi:hypothetical protein